MKKYEITSGESLKLTLSGENFENSVIYLSLKNEEGEVVLKKKKEVFSNVAEVELTSQDTWGMRGSFEGEIFVIFATGEVVVESFVLVLRDRILDEIW